MVLVGLSIVSPVRAEQAEGIAEAAGLVEMADFEGALGVLEATEAAGGLNRASVLRVEALRALIHYALSNQGEMDRALGRLASLEPAHEFDDTVPPALQERFERVRRGLDGVLRVEVEAREIRGGFRIDVTLHGDIGELVGETLIFARLPGGEWVRTEGSRASIPARGDAAVEYYVNAIGPGGALLLDEGSEEAPLIVGTPGADTTNLRVQEVIRDAAVISEETERRTSPWVWVGLGLGAAAVAAGIVTAVLLTSGGQTTNLGSPEVEWP